MKDDLKFKFYGRDKAPVLKIKQVNGEYLATICFKRRTKHVGRYKTEKEALLSGSIALKDYRQSFFEA